jgi:hypothetical protein
MRERGAGYRRSAMGPTWYVRGGRILGLVAIAVMLIL